MPPEHVELIQALVARREPRRGQTTHRIAPLGLALAVLTAPLGLVYGWQIVTRAGAASGEPGDALADGDEPAPAPAATRPTKRRAGSRLRPTMPRAPN